MKSVKGLCLIFDHIFIAGTHQSQPRSYTQGVRTPSAQSQLPSGLIPFTLKALSLMSLYAIIASLGAPSLHKRTPSRATKLLRKRLERNQKGQFTTRLVIIHDEGIAVSDVVCAISPPPGREPVQIGRRRSALKSRKMHSRNGQGWMQSVAGRLQQ
jgi:hypothetical protein